MSDDMASCETLEAVHGTDVGTTGEDAPDGDDSPRDGDGGDGGTTVTDEPIAIVYGPCPDVFDDYYDEDAFA